MVVTRGWGEGICPSLSPADQSLQKRERVLWGEGLTRMDLTPQMQCPSER